MPPATTGPAVLVRVAVVAGQSGYQTRQQLWQQVQNPDPAGYPVRLNSRRQGRTEFQKRGIRWAGLLTFLVPYLLIPSRLRKARRIAQAPNPMRSDMPKDVDHIPQHAGHIIRKS